MPETMMKGIMGVMLLLCGLQDAFQKKICIWMIALGALLISICVSFSNTFSIPDRIGGVLVGVSIVFISKITGGKIGMGDGFLLCATGIGLGLWRNLELFAYALLAAAIVSIVLLAFRLADRKKSIPFVPFLLLSYLFITVIPS